jgi:hypothetical protein
MKTITLILLFLTLNTVIVCAEDVHLVETLYNGAFLDPKGVPSESPVYVLLLPIHDGTHGGHVYINPVVLKTFDAKEIGQIINLMVKIGELPSGSVLHIDPSALMAEPPEEQIKALTDYCKKIGIKVDVSGTA